MDASLSNPDVRHSNNNSNNNGSSNNHNSHKKPAAAAAPPAISSPSFFLGRWMMCLALVIALGIGLYIGAATSSSSGMGGWGCTTKLVPPIGQQQFKTTTQTGWSTTVKGDGFGSEHEHGLRSTSIIINRSSPVVPESHVCNRNESKFQAESYCPIYHGRHNLASIFLLIRLKLPFATTFVDVGANKGLVSARWLELWMPQSHIRPETYAKSFLAGYFKSHNAVNPGSVCGVTNMCVSPNLFEIQAIIGNPVLSLSHRKNITVHSFEPSQYLFDAHQEFLMQASRLQPHWQWYRIAASHVDGETYFAPEWDEGGQIGKGGGQNVHHGNNTRMARLDTLAYKDQLFGTADDEVMIDVLKIDAESFDVKVISGASQLLLNQRIRVLMWETPNDEFPVHFHDKLGGSINSFSDLIRMLDEQAGMTCYFTGANFRSVRLTGCIPRGGHNTVENPRQLTPIEQHPKCIGPYCPFGNGCPITHSNAMCVHRILASDLYHALESKVLAWDEKISS